MDWDNSKPLDPSSRGRGGGREGADLEQQQDKCKFNLDMFN